MSTAIADARAAIGAVNDVPVWSMDSAETTAALDEVTRVEAQLAELRARLLTHADGLDIAADSGTTSTANWYAVATRTTRPRAHGLMRIATGLDTGEKISAGAARRLACEAGIIPAVLGGKSRVLDVGRAARFHTQTQRIVKIIEVGGCEVDGCDQPPANCLHHPIRWVDGGETNRDGVMICPGHHAKAHDTRYDFQQLPTGKYGFHRRT